MYQQQHYNHHHQPQQQYSNSASILYPNDWSRFDPSQNSYSPLAQYSSHTLKEHSETLDKLALQLELIARHLAESDVQGSEDHRRYTKMLDALQREESDIVVLLSHNRQRIEDLQQATSTEVVRRREEVELNNQTNRDLEEELRNLSHVEADLMTMKRSIEEKLAATSERKSMFSREFRHGMSILETDHQEAKTASAFTTAILSGGSRPRPSLVESPSRHRSPMKGFDIPRSPNVPPARAPLMPTLSPNRGRPAATVVPVGTSGFRAPLRGSPKRSAASVLFAHEHPAPLSPRKMAESVVTPPPPPSLSYQSPNVSVAGEDFRPLSEAAERLHSACRVGDHESIRKLLREFQSAASEKHPVTGDTALHVLCSAPVFSEQAVKDVLLAFNEAVYAFNKAGYFPFHLACLNVADSTDGLKMYFTQNLGVDPYLQTKTGETVAHLCARSDRTHSGLRCVIERMKVNPRTEATLANRAGYFKKMNALDVAIDMQNEASQNKEYLTWWFSQNTNHNNTSSHH